MENATLFDIVSLLTGAISIALALFAMWQAKQSEKEARSNYEKTKDVLAEIDKKSAIIERTVSESQQKLMDTMTNIINETVIPKQQDIGEQLGAQFMMQMLQDPNNLGQNLDMLQKLAELGDKNTSNK